MLRLDRAIPHMKGFSEYFQNITRLKPSILSGNHATNKLSELDIFVKLVFCQFLLFSQFSQFSWLMT